MPQQQPALKRKYLQIAATRCFEVFDSFRPKTSPKCYYHKNFRTTADSLQRRWSAEDQCQETRRQAPTRCPLGGRAASTTASNPYTAFSHVRLDCSLNQKRLEDLYGYSQFHQLGTFDEQCNADKNNSDGVTMKKRSPHQLGFASRGAITLQKRSTREKCF